MTDEKIDITSGMTREELKEMCDTLLDNLTKLTKVVHRKYPSQWHGKTGEQGTIAVAIELIERFVP